MAETTPTPTAFPTVERPPVHLRRSPLAHLAEAMAAGGTDARPEARAGDTVLTLREVPFLTMVGLRAAPGSASARALAEALGTRLPERVGEVTGTGEAAVLWLGPDEQLVIAAPDLPLGTRLREALDGLPGAAVDLSANRTTLELSGPRAADVLRKTVRLDLHPRAFPAGTAVSTLLDSVQVILWRTTEHTFRVLPRASFAEHVARVLLDGMREFTAPGGA